VVTLTHGEPEVGRLVAALRDLAGEHPDAGGDTDIALLRGGES
jgi:hypothetical protein